MNQDAAMNALSLRPLEDMQAMPWVREIRLRTPWENSHDGSVTLIDVTIDRFGSDMFYWDIGVCDPENPDGFESEDPGIDDLGDAYDTPLLAYTAACEAIADWLKSRSTT